MQDTDAQHCNLRYTLLKNALYTSVLIYIVLYSSVLRWGQYRTLFYCTVLHCTLVYCNWCRTEEVMPSLSSNGACYLGQHRNSIEKLSIIFPLLVSQSPFSWAWFDTRTTTITFWKCWCVSKEREFCNNTLHRIAENGKEGGFWSRLRSILNVGNIL